MTEIASQVIFNHLYTGFNIIQEGIDKVAESEPTENECSMTSGLQKGINAIKAGMEKARFAGQTLMLRETERQDENNFDYDAQLYAGLEEMVKGYQNIKKELIAVSSIRANDEIPLIHNIQENVLFIRNGIKVADCANQMLMQKKGQLKTLTASVGDCSDIISLKNSAPKI